MISSGELLDDRERILGNSRLTIDPTSRATPVTPMRFSAVEERAGKKCGRARLRIVVPIPAAIPIAVPCRVFIF